MTVNTVAHLNFRGNARAALEFYQTVFGGDVATVTYSDAHNVQDPAEADQVMWGQVVSEAGFRIMAYDVPASLSWDAGTIPYFVSVRGTDDDEIGRYWHKLVDGSTVIAPLAPAQWAPLYGMLKDRFGVTWVLDVEVPWG